MSLFSEEEQAAPRRTLLRSKRARRTAACITLPIVLYAVLATVSLLGGPRVPLLPLPTSGDTNAVEPVAGPPTAGPTDVDYPYVDGDPPPSAAPTPSVSTELPGIGPGSSRRPGGHLDGGDDEHAGRPTPGSPTTVPAGDPTRPVRPTITARPPVLPTTATPTPTVAPSKPTTPPTPTPSPTATPTPPVPEDEDPSLVDRLFGWLDALTP